MVNEEWNLGFNGSQYDLCTLLIIKLKADAFDIYMSINIYCKILKIYRDIQ